MILVALPHHYGLANHIIMWLADGDSPVCYIVRNIEADCLDALIIFSMGI